MNKQKIFENHSNTNYYEVRKYKRHLDKKEDFETLPSHTPMRKNSYDFYYKNFYVNTRHLINFIMSRIGYDWDDVYSELISKIKKKERESYKDSVKNIVTDVYWENFDGIDVPCFTSKYLYHHDIRATKIVFIDEFNILSYYDDIDQLMTEYKKRNRIKKLKMILIGIELLMKKGATL